MILSGSRYVGVPFTGIKTRDGKTRKFLHDRRVFTRKDVSENAIEHIVSGEETLDSIAFLYYKDDRLWWLIADVNDVLWMFDITPGQALLVPDPGVLRDLGVS